ncbi:hypothetical protein LC605_20715 [Nostoc sp. CHAB 5836]|uniref:hypothetical protein n=1 Tax=Nostoc sp. CHAB 5836 TaxID=2780404 RepID=UPI001E4B22FA|nr:hypothetical protein [Nostoc sp. CHAB 5836]MCC5617464.1 hypothetical protein [Nostoc sp. CHAB 5836]
MFRLTSTNLPLVGTRAKLAPAFTIWQENDRGTGAILRVNCYGHWQENPGWELDTLPLGAPTATGKYYRQVVSAQIQQIALWGKVESAIASTPDTFWQSDTEIHLYQKNSALPTSAVVIAAVTAPPAVGNNYAIALDRMNATSISSDGLIFTPGIGVGNFSQEEDTVTIYGDAAYSLNLGQELLITAEIELSFSSPYLSIASFYLPDIAYCDRIDWAGHSFSPAREVLSPQKWEFTWDAIAKVANLFLEATSMPYFEPIQATHVPSGLGAIKIIRNS